MRSIKVIYQSHAPVVSDATNRLRKQQLLVVYCAVNYRQFKQLSLHSWCYRSKVLTLKTFVWEPGDGVCFKQRSDEYI